MTATEQTVHCIPVQNPKLGFQYEIPADWQEMEIPAEEPDFDNPVFFLALSVSCAKYGVAAFSVAVRPAYSDGAVHDWAAWLCMENQIDLTSLMPVEVAGIRMWQAEGRQSNEAGPTVVRALFFEDGGRLYNLSLMAAEVLWPGMEPLMQGMAESFALDFTQGATAPFVAANA